MEHIYNFIIPFRQFSPCTALLCIAQIRRNCTGARSRAARESGRTSMWGLPPPHPWADSAHISGCRQIARLVPFLRSRPASCFTEGMSLAVCLCHMVTHDHSQRVLHPSSPAYPCLPLQQGGRGMPERGRHGTSPLRSMCCAWIV